jgi:hypothetical protein
MIDWNAFTWEAFAALVTGLAAVVAAVIVGLRQAGIQLAQARISSKQTDILDKQVQLEELKLRNELFDRRFEIYQKTQAYLVALSSIDKRSDIKKTLMEFLTARDTSQFLFHKRGAATLLNIYQLGEEISAAHDAVETARAGNRDVTPHANALAAAKAKIQPIYNVLHESFPELWLAEIRNHLN